MIIFSIITKTWTKLSFESTIRCKGLNVSVLLSAKFTSKYASPHPLFLVLHTNTSCCAWLKILLLLLPSLKIVRKRNSWLNLLRNLHIQILKTLNIEKMNMMHNDEHLLEFAGFISIKILILYLSFYILKNVIMISRG